MKQYQKPETKSTELRTLNIICVSGGGGAPARSGSISSQGQTNVGF